MRLCLLVPKQDAPLLGALGPGATNGGIVEGYDERTARTAERATLVMEKGLGVRERNKERKKEERGD